MSDYIDFSIASSNQIERALGARIERLRLARNWTQSQLAERAGVSVRTMGRLEKGAGATLDTFIRVLRALELQDALQSLLPDPVEWPIERMDRKNRSKRLRRRARPRAASDGGPSDAGPANDGRASTWKWGDES